MSVTLLGVVRGMNDPMSPDVSAVVAAKAHSWWKPSSGSVS